MNCQKCKTPNSERHSFCVNCAEPLIEAPTGDKTEKLVIPPETFIPSSSGSLQSLTGTTLNGKYQLDAKLAEGISYIVYLATQMESGGKVAVKVFRDVGLNTQEAEELFLQEMKIIAGFAHPNAIAILDYGISKDSHRYVVTEVIEGRSLRELISSQGPLSMSLAAEVALQVCSALEKAHQLELIHGDIKPDNIIIGEDEQRIRVKILDLGYAKLLKGTFDLTQTGEFIGTPRYISPEQCQGESITSKSDIYSLGVVLYEVLSGTVPFNAPSPTAVAVQHVTKAPAPIRETNHLISEDVESAVFHALEKKPADRPISAAAFARELRSAVQSSQQTVEDVPIEVESLPSDPTVELSSASETSVPVTQVSNTPQNTNSAPGFFSDHIERSSKQRVFAKTPVLLGILTLGFFFIIFASGLAAWMFLPSGFDFMEQPRAVNTKKADETLSNSEKEPESSDTTVPVETAEDVLNKLRNERSAASPGDIGKIDEKLKLAEKKYPNDYRFTYERARLFKPTVATSDHHKPFSLLMESARKAIKNRRSTEMLKEINRDGRDDFRRLASGHKEWNAVRNALTRNDASHLHEDDH